MATFDFEGPDGMWCIDGTWFAYDYKRSPEEIGTYNEQMATYCGFGSPTGRLHHDQSLTGEHVKGFYDWENPRFVVAGDRTALDAHMHRGDWAGIEHRIMLGDLLHGGSYTTDKPADAQTVSAMTERMDEMIRAVLLGGSLALDRRSEAVKSASRLTIAKMVDNG